MAKLLWDQIGERFYETGTDHGVVYPTLLADNKGYGGGVAWNGLTNVSETPSGADTTDIYADNIKYLSIRAAEDFGGTIQAYTYPDEFAILDGSAAPTVGVRVYQQNRRAFGFSYRSIIGNDTELNDFAYRLHMIYGASVSPSERGYQTVNESPEAIQFSWEFKTTPVPITVVDPTTGKAFKPTALLTVDSNKVTAEKLAALEEILYGTDDVDPRMPLPDEIIQMFVGTGTNG